jgi:hypothetical protein
VEPVVSPLGLAEGIPDGFQGVLVAASLNDVSGGQTVVRCCNTTDAPVSLDPGIVIAYLQAVSVNAIKNLQEIPVSMDCRAVQAEKSPVALVQVPVHLTQLYEEAVAACPTDEAALQIAELLTNYADVFSSGEGDIGRTNWVSHSITVKPGTEPVRHQPRRLGHEKELKVERQLDALQRQGLIEPGDGSWSSPVVLVRKKDGSWRFCVDYRKLNDVTIRDAYPLPRIDDTLDALSGSQYFSTLDMLSGYWRVQLDDDAQEKAAFVTRSGLWK